MTFVTSIGNLDIVAGDKVKISNDVLPTPENMDGYLSVLSVSAGNPTQVQVQYQDASGLHSVWLDTIWVIGNLRPILPS